jgi:adenylate kinase
MEVSTLECFKRLSARGKTAKKRTYDLDMELIINRLDEFHTRTHIVGDYYKKHKKFTTVDGHGTEDEIFARLTETIDHKLTTGR